MHVNEPGLASYYMQKWRLTSVGPAIQTPTSSLFPVTRNNNALMLKIIKEEGDEQNSCTALLHYNGVGAVNVFEHTDDAFVMQRAVAGKTLKMFRAEQGDEKTTRIISDVLKQLHCAPSSKSEINLPNLKTLQGAFAAMRGINERALPLSILEHAEKLFDSLIASTSHYSVLHGDLHHDNLLLDQDDGWLAIDPKGFLGDPVYDCAALFKNPLDDDGVADEFCIFSRADILQEQLGYSRDRILQWAFVHCVLSVIWSVQDGAPIGPALPVATALFQVFCRD